MPAVVALTSSHVPTLPTDWNATVHIYAVDGVTPATVYADANGNTTGANPLPRVRGSEFGIDGTGYWLCYVTVGSYVVSVTVPGGSPQTHSVTVAADVDPAPVPDYDPSGAAAAETGRATAAEAVNATAITVETARATAAEALKVAKAGDTMSGDLAMGGHRVTGLADPSGNQDAATKAHVAAQIVALVGGAPGILDTLGEIATALQSDESVAAALATTVANETTRAEAAEALAAQKSANLSDLASAPAARSSLGLGNVDNTSDANKPVSTAQAAADTAVATAAATDATTKANAAQATSSPRLTRTAVKTGNYTAAAGDLVPCDTTSAAFTVTLPNAPAVGTRVGIKLVTLGAGHAVTIACAGSDVFNKTAGPTTGTLTLLNQALQVQYDTGGIWTVVADDLPLTALNGSYLPILTDPQTITLNADGSVATVTVQGVTTTYTYNADGTVATEVRNGVTRTYAYTAGNLTSVA